MRNPYSGQPFSTSDSEIAAALEDVSVPALLLSCIHMSGDDSLLDGPLRPAGIFLNEVQGFMSDEDQTTARKVAFDVIRDYRDRGCPEPAPIDSRQLKRMMDWLVCTDVPNEYVPMLLEEMELDGRDSRVTAFQSSPQARAEFPVVVVGCGQSGLLAAIRMQQAGVPYTVVEKNAGVGGTWWENTYPGARVDVGNHFYCYSFEPTDHWSEYFAQQPELQAYFEAVMHRHGIAEHVRFSTEVLGAEWDDATSTWSVRIRSADGTEEILTARAVISAVGQLNRPYIPAITGAETFDGPAFHTARWDHDVDLSGKDVVLIGAGASGFQVAPAIADDVHSLTIFQRTAQWMFPNPNYHAEVGPGVQWALKHLPFYGRWYRFLLFWPGCDAAFAAARVDPDWPDQQKAVSAANDMARMMFTEWISSQIHALGAQGPVDVVRRGAGGRAQPTPAQTRRCDRARTAPLVPPSAPRSTPDRCFGAPSLCRDRDPGRCARCRRCTRDDDLPDRYRRDRARRLARMGSPPGPGRGDGDRRRRVPRRSRLLHRILVDCRPDAGNAAAAPARRRWWRFPTRLRTFARAPARTHRGDSSPLHRLSSGTRR